MERSNGYYWIRLDDHITDPVTENGWEVAYYKNGEGWYSIWDGGSFGDDELLEINEEKLEAPVPIDKNFKFDWDIFYKYVKTYSPEKHGLDLPDVILKDMIYGLGISIDSTNFRFSKGFQNFQKWLKNYMK